jgi:hypothetical protein
VYDPGALKYAVRHLERFPPGTPYPEVFARVADRFARPPLAGAVLAADQTAVGRPVVEALRRSVARTAVRAVTVTAGHAARTDDRGGWLVPRAELVGTLQVLLQSGRLKVAESLPEAPTLAREMEAFRAEVSLSPDDAAAAWREGAHDDLVLAVAIAAWTAERHGPAGAGRPGVVPLGWARAWGWRAGRGA